MDTPEGVGGGPSQPAPPSDANAPAASHNDGAIEAVVSEIATLSAHPQVDQLLAVQQKILARLTESREALAEFAGASQGQADEECRELDRSAEILRLLRKDLEHVWRRIRAIKDKLVDLQQQQQQQQHDKG